MQRSSTGSCRRADFVPFRSLGPRWHAVTAMLGIGVLAAPAAAQLRFDTLAKQHLPPGDGTAVVRVDVDGDGDADLVVDGHHLFLNSGEAIFADVTATHLPIAGGGAPATGDVDRDGDVDLVLGSFGQDRLYLNDGSGTFTDVTATHMPVDSGPTRAVAVGDVDGDGDLDLMLARGTERSTAQQDLLYLNNGNGTFTDATDSHMPADNDVTNAVVLGDVDGDGDLDAVFGNGYWVFGQLFPIVIPHGQQTRIYVNGGQGVFSDATATLMPSNSYVTSALAMDDVDGDGDPDLILGNAGLQDRLYLNDGTGRLTDATATHMPADDEWTAALALGDVDSDGDRDLALGRGLYLNDGTGVFSDATASRLPADGPGGSSVALGDLDGDGDADLVFAGRRNRLYLNDGAGFFIDLTHTPPSLHANALGDVDGDGDLDVVAPSSLYLSLHLNDGRGGFTDVTATHIPPGLRLVSDFALGDVEGDGDLDLLMSVDYGPNLLLLNDGQGVFSRITGLRLISYPANTRTLALGDVDGNGALDVVFCNSAHQQNRLFLNDGTGHFSDVTATHMPVDLNSTWAAALEDMDGDGDLDLVCGNYGSDRQDRLFLNNGNGVFTDATASHLPTDQIFTPILAVGDVDSDGDRDLVLGGAPSRLYLNDGAGYFSDVTSSHLPGAQSSRDMALGDVDEDGDPDLILGKESSSAPPRLLINGGNGVFTDVTSTQMPATAGSSVALGDLDGDDDLDLVSSELHFNLQRQLYTSLLAFSGREYRFEVRARSERPTTAEFALLYASPRTASIPFPPYGTIGLDPGALIPLPLVLLAPGTGIGSVAVRLPNNSALVGATIYSQAILVQVPIGAHLTNVASDVVMQ